MASKCTLLLDSIILPENYDSMMVKYPRNDDRVWTEGHFKAQVLGNEDRCPGTSNVKEVLYPNAEKSGLALTAFTLLSQVELEC